MSTPPEDRHRDWDERPLDLFSDSEAEERADIVEDRRRQRELDDAELGGEA
jgi:hypothetical protein